MLEVMDRFKLSFDQYADMPEGRKTLLREYTKFKLEQEARLSPAIRFDTSKKGG